MEYISETLGCREGDIYSINPAKNADGSVSGIQFLAPGGAYQYDYAAGVSSDMPCREAAGLKAAEGKFGLTDGLRKRRV
ncbi:MAG: hypothetical protein ACLRMZ_16315 [Blautia marasmi]